MAKYQVQYRCEEASLTGTETVQPRAGHTRAKFTCQGCDCTMTLDVAGLHLTPEKGHRFLRVAEVGKSE